MTSETSSRISVKERAREIEKFKSKDAETPCRQLTDKSRKVSAPSAPDCRELKYNTPSTRIRAVVPDVSALLGLNSDQQAGQRQQFLTLQEVQQDSATRRSSEGDVFLLCKPRCGSLLNTGETVTKRRRSSAVDSHLRPVHEEAAVGQRCEKAHNETLDTVSISEEEEAQKSSGRVQENPHPAKSGPFKRSSQTWVEETSSTPLSPAIFSRQTPEAIAAVSELSSSVAAEAEVSSNPLEEILASLERICDEFDTGSGAGHQDAGLSLDNSHCSGEESQDGRNSGRALHGDRNQCEYSWSPPCVSKHESKNPDINNFSLANKQIKVVNGQTSVPSDETASLNAINGFYSDSDVADSSIVSDKSSVFVSSAVLYLSKDKDDASVKNSSSKQDTDNEIWKSQTEIIIHEVEGFRDSNDDKGKIKESCMQQSSTGQNHRDSSPLHLGKSKAKNLLVSDQSPDRKKRFVFDGKLEDKVCSEESWVSGVSKFRLAPSVPTCLSAARKSSFTGTADNLLCSPIVLKEQRSCSLGEVVTKSDSPLFDIEKAKSILAGLDFGKYKRRQHAKVDTKETPSNTAAEALNNRPENTMDSHKINSPKLSPAPKSVSLGHNAKLKDLFDLLKASNPESPGRRNFSICRSSSFSTAESLEEFDSSFCNNGKNIKSGAKQEEQQPQKTSTLPRRKSPSKKLLNLPSAPISVAPSCQSASKISAEMSGKAEADEGLIPDAESESGNYASAYESCVSSDPKKHDSFRRTGGHVRSSSDVTEGHAPGAGSASSSDMALHDQRKRKKSAGKSNPSTVASAHLRHKSPSRGQEPAKSGTGRSLTYPPQRKTSIPEDSKDHMLIDNGLRSLQDLSNTVQGISSSEDTRHTGRMRSEGEDGDCFDDVEDDHQRSLLLRSDLSLADSHLCPSEGTIEDSFQDVVDSVMRCPDEQHLSVEDRNLGGSNCKTPKKKHHSDPGSDVNTGVNAEVGAVFLPDGSIGSSRSEPDLNDSVIISSSSSASSSSSSALNHTSKTRPQNHTEDEDDEERHHLRLMVLDNTHGGSEPPTSARTAPRHHVRVGSGGGSNRFLADAQNMESPRSPQEQRRYSKRRLRGPYGEMLEEEMRKSGEKVKPNFNDLSFLQEICVTKQQTGKQQMACPETAPVSFPSPAGRPFISSQSLDDPKSDVSPGSAPKRKISANYPLLLDSGTATMDVPSSDKRAIQRSSSSCSQDSTGVGSGSSSSDAMDSKVIPGHDAIAKDNNNSLHTSNGLIDFPKMGISLSDTRTHVVGELYDTEKSYVESLQILANKYMKPLKTPEYNGVVDTGLVDEIFFQIPEILNHHESFLEELKQRLSSWDNKQKVGDVFVEAFTKQHVIDTYTAFINNWKSAKDAIKIASQAKPAFARFLEHMTRDHKGKLTLDALLIMPVQRIPRYELLIKELLKHTPVDHPDHRLLVSAQHEVHELAVKINRMEREAFAQEQAQQRLRDIEQLIDGVVDLVQSDRGFLRHDMVHMPGGLGTKKERCLFLFTDVLLITSMKKKSATIRKPSATSSGSPNNYNGLEMNKYKLLTKFSLDNLDITKSTDSSFRRLLQDIENLEIDMDLLSKISELASDLSSQHQALDEAVKELTSTVSKQLTEKQNCDSQLVSLELTVTTQEGVEGLTILFSSKEKRTTWELAFNEAKQKLALSIDRRPPPEFMHPLPIRKTRAGLQFTCAAATLGLNQQGLRDVWVCNSDGYVGQVCVLSLQPEPTVMSCNGVCNARILTIASIPAATSCAYPIASGFPEKNRWRPTMPDNLTGVSIEVEECDEDFVSEGTKNGNIQLDSDTSDEEDESESADDERSRDEGRRQRSSSIPKDEGFDDMDYKQPTMWLGTEDGCILVYNCNDNIRTKKNKIKFQHSAAIHCIIFLDNRVFVALANGEVDIYKKDPGGGWSNSDPHKVVVGSLATPVTRMLAVAGKLWCGCQNLVKVVNTFSLQIEDSFPVSNDTSRTVLCMVASGLGVWIALQHSAVIRLFHAVSYECLLDVNIAPAVTKILAGCDDIIRQHKAACLRVTAVLACKDLLWIGTSAGVILTLALPHLTSSTTRLDSTPNIVGLPHGHTGHVRFLTCVDMGPGTFLDSKISRTLRSKETNVSGRRSSTAASAACRLLVISGGDGYEDFRNCGLGLGSGTFHMYEADVLSITHLYRNLVYIVLIFTFLLVILTVDSIYYHRAFIYLGFQTLKQYNIDRFRQSSNSQKLAVQKKLFFIIVPQNMWMKKSKSNYLRTNVYIYKNGKKKFFHFPVY